MRKTWLIAAIMMAGGALLITIALMRTHERHADHRAPAFEADGSGSTDVSQEPDIGHSHAQWQPHSDAPAQDHPAPDEVGHG